MSKMLNPRRFDGGKKENTTGQPKKRTGTDGDLRKEERERKE